MTRTIVPVNPGDREWTNHRYILAFGAYGDTLLMAWANNLGDALDECVDWIADNAPGLLCDEAVHDEYRAAIAEGLDEEAAQERATIDTTCAGNAGHYLHSWEWSIAAEDPTRAEILALQGRKEVRP
jgi:hypothetical protein